MKWFSSYFAVSLLCSLSAPLPLAGEAPTRASLTDQVLAIRYAWFDPYPPEDDYSGIWTLDLHDMRFRRNRPFLVTTGTNRIVPPGFIGGEGHLTVDGNTATYQTWPHLVDFDLYSWRMLRRRPTSPRPEEVGWVIQGPTLGPAESSLSGLDPGVYGFASCARGWLTSGLGWTDPIGCPTWPFPGPANTTSYTNDAALLRAPVPADDAAAALVATFQPTTNNRPALCFDTSRIGFWRASESGLQLIPVIDGSIGQPTTTLDFTFGPFAEPDALHSITSTLHYSPWDSLLVIVSSTEEIALYSVAPDTGDGTLLASWPLSNDRDGAPNALASVGPPPGRYEQLVPIIGGGRGRHGTDWTTELWLYNPAPVEQDVQLRRVTRPESVFTMTLAPHASSTIPDALTWLGGGDNGDGTDHEALVVTAQSHWGAELVIAGRISTPGSGGGRYGHAVTAVPSRVGYSNHTQYAVPDDELTYVQSPGLRAAHIDLDYRVPGRYRYNLGAVNDRDEAITLTLMWGYGEWREFNGWRPPETVQQLEVAAHGVTLVDVASLFSDTVRQSWAPRIAVLGDRPAAVWLSVVDNLTGDATFVPFTSYNYYEDTPQDRLTLPVAARTSGLEGSLWRTDLIGFDSYGAAAAGPVYVTYHPSGATPHCGGATRRPGIDGEVEGEVGIDPDVWWNTVCQYGLCPHDQREALAGFQMLVDDVIGKLPGCATETQTKGGLEIATGAWFAGYSRTYTSLPEGGTYGSMLPLYPVDGWPQQHFAGLGVDGTQRVNVGLYNGLTERAVVHRLELYAMDGALVAQRQITVEPNDLVQQPLDVMLGRPGGLPHGLYGLTVIPLDEPGSPGRSWAYVSLVDNITNDPVNLW